VELDKEKNKFRDSQHKRATKLIVILISVLFILSFVALILKEYELVKWILSLSFAVGAGAGITSLIKKRKIISFE